MMMQIGRIGVLLAALWAGLATVSAAELLYFTRAGCPYCIKWEREIEPIYPKTPEGMTAPLRKVRTDRLLPADIRFNPPIRITPTFILMENGQEVGRFLGYTDDSTFWSLLNMLLRQKDDADTPGPIKTRHEDTR